MEYMSHLILLSLCFLFIYLFVFIYLVCCCFFLCHSSKFLSCFSFILFCLLFISFFDYTRSSLCFLSILYSFLLSRFFVCHSITNFTNHNLYSCNQEDTLPLNAVHKSKFIDLLMSLSL